MRLLLLLLLLSSGEVLGTPSPHEYCYELAEVLEEAVIDEYIKEHEAERIVQTCLTIR